MISKAIARYIKVTPRKTRMVIRLIKGLDVPRALAILANTYKSPSVHIARVVKSAASNATSKTPSIKEGDLYISKITADGGPTTRRFKAQAMGRATKILKRTSHIYVELDVKK